MTTAGTWYPPTFLSNPPFAPMTQANTEPLWRRIGGSVGPYGLGPTEIAAILKLIADEVERRGDIDYDRDPGETADWLRAEGVQALLDAER